MDVESYAIMGRWGESGSLKRDKEMDERVERKEWRVGGKERKLMD